MKYPLHSRTGYRIFGAAPFTVARRLNNIEAVTPGAVSLGRIALR